MSSNEMKPLEERFRREGGNREVKMGGGKTINGTLMEGEQKPRMNINLSSTSSQTTG